MKTKSLTYLLATILLSACTGKSSATFSSSNNSVSSEPSSLSSEVSSSESSNNLISSSSLSGETTSSVISSEEPASSSDESSSSSSAQSYSGDIDYYDGYYANLTTWTDGNDLKAKLHTIINNGYTAISFDDPNWETNIDADHTKYDFEYLDVVYSAEPVFKTDSNKKWQREHAWCASYMCGSLTAKATQFVGRATDFHNLFASSANGNTSRSDKCYGMSDKTADNYTDRTVNGGLDGYSYGGKDFEPANIDKGRLSRAIFYMATMYTDTVHDEKNNIDMGPLNIVEGSSGSKGSYTFGNLSTLISWNNTYGVDYLEMQHNVSVYSNKNNPSGVAQGNRNPYVDYPELVDYVYGSKQDQAGSLKDLTPSMFTLGLGKHVLSHYAIKEAKRDYSYGDKLSANDYKVVAVYKDFSTEVVDEGISNSLDNYTFVENDGDYKTATITTPINEISYNISLNPIKQMSSGEIFLNTDDINKSQPGVEQEVTYGNKPFLLTFESKAATPLTINNIKNGDDAIGVTFGSGTKSITQVVLKTKDSYTVDAAFVKAFRGNANSSYTLTIKVGDTVLLPSTTVNNADAKLFGKKLSEPLTGQITYTFTGSTSLKINSVAFNEIIA